MSKFYFQSDQDKAIQNFINNFSDFEVDDEDYDESSEESLYIILMQMDFFFFQVLVISKVKWVSKSFLTWTKTEFYTHFILDSDLDDVCHLERNNIESPPPPSSNRLEPETSPTRSLSPVVVSQPKSPGSLAYEPTGTQLAKVNV